MLPVFCRCRSSAEVHPAGTKPGSAIHTLPAEAIAEVGVDMPTEAPRPIDLDLRVRVDRVFVLSSEAAAGAVKGMVGTIETWETEKPSARGTEGIERMRLVRDDIAAWATPWPPS
jgi:arsenate-mycothiol transferase